MLDWLAGQFSRNVLAWETRPLAFCKDLFMEEKVRQIFFFILSDSKSYSIERERWEIRGKKEVQTKTKMLICIFTKTPLHQDKALYK